MGQTVTVAAVHGRDALRQRLLDLGLVTGTAVRVMGTAPLGDPMELWLRGSALTLRRWEAARVEISWEEAGHAHCTGWQSQRGKDHPV